MNHRERSRAIRLSCWLLGSFVTVLAIGASTLRLPVIGPSMAPCVYGQADSLGKPDTVAVNRLAYLFQNPKRFDTVVFRHPQEPTRLLVKRIVGLPGESVQILGGDVFVNGTRVVKTDREWEAVRVPLFDLAAHELDSFWSVAGRSLRANILEGTQDEVLSLHSLPIRVQYRRADGSLAPGFPQPVQDVGLSLGLLREGEVLELALTLPGGEKLLLDWNEERVAGEVLAGESLELFRVVVGCRRLNVEFTQVDGSLRLRLLEGSAELPLLSWRDTLPPREQQRGQAAITCELQGTKGRVVELNVWRDLYYSSSVRRFGVRLPIELPARAYYLLGDNSVDSSDSREFGEVRRNRILGRVEAVVAPWNRIRMILTALPW